MKNSLIIIILTALFCLTSCKNTRKAQRKNSPKTTTKQPKKEGIIVVSPPKEEKVKTPKPNPAPNKPTTNPNPIPPAPENPTVPTPPEEETTDKDVNPYKTDKNIRKLQEILYLNGYIPGRIDGDLKEQTLNALQEFQQNADLPIGDLTAKTFDGLGVTRMDFTVADIQDALFKKGFDPGPIDGLVGPMTKGAYQGFLEKNQLQEAHGMTEEIKSVLFSNDAKYNNTTPEDPLFNPNEEVPTAPLDIDLGSIEQANVELVQKALQSKGYDPGDITADMNPQTEDALFSYQVDFRLPIGGLNQETLQSLGFK